jgi:prephenate dehydrogenase
LKVAVIGAGKMGRWFTKFLTEEGDSVVVFSRTKEKMLALKDEFGVEVAESNVEAVEGVDRVLLCVPLESLEAVLEEIGPHIRSKQTVMDICSIKEIPVNLLHKYVKKGKVLGTHPVFGPGAKSIRGQNFVLTPVDDRDMQIAVKFGKWLEEKGAKVVVTSPRDHDELMSVVLGFPHFLGLVVGDTLLNYGNFVETKDVAGASYRLLLTLAEAVASEETGFYSNLQMSLPEVEKIEGLFLEKVEEWLDLVRRKDCDGFSSRMEEVKKLLKKLDPDYERRYDVMYKLLDEDEDS